jgi:hypothetical protein
MNDTSSVFCREEFMCRFCEQQLPSWQEAYQLGDIDASRYISMGIRVEGRIVIVNARRGPDGVREFERKVRDLLGYPDNVELDFTFSCSAPDGSEGACLPQRCWEPGLCFADLFVVHLLVTSRILNYFGDA